MVKLGKRTDTVDHKQAASVAVWQDRFMGLWGHLDCHCRHYLRSEKVIVRLQDRLSTAESDGVDPVHIEEAENVLERHRASLVWRRHDLEELVSEFDAFWSNRPEVDEWLRMSWFANGPETDPVIEVMPRLGVSESWREIAHMEQDRGIATNPSRCPY